MDIGILGGTFDPIHVGHLIVAEEVRTRLGLTGVVFMPAGHPWLKSQRRITAGKHRLQMVRLAIASNPYFSVSRLELDRPGPSYSVDTVSQLRLQHGGEGRLCFIIGYDIFAEIPQWQEPQRLAQMCELVVVRRSGTDLDLDALEKALPGLPQRMTFLDTIEIGISATDIRRRVAQGLSIRYLVPEAVEGYIHLHNLYTKKNLERSSHE